MAIIKDIKAREIIDSRGNPTVECDIILSDNLLEEQRCLQELPQENMKQLN